VGDRDKDAIALTHVCQTWRELFVSRASLWIDLTCTDPNKTRVYLELSKSSPINLSLRSADDVYHFEPSLKLISSATERLKSVDINVWPGDLRLTRTYLSRPAPLLEVLSIRSDDDPTPLSALFNGDLSSLRKLCLETVRTELPWRNMVNLTPFALGYGSPEVSAGQLLDFFECAPYLREIDTRYIATTPHVQNEWLVPLACLQRMDAGAYPSSHFFDHLLIPVGAHLR